MPQSNEKQKVKKPTPAQSENVQAGMPETDKQQAEKQQSDKPQSDRQQGEKHHADKQVTGQHHTGNNDGAPVYPGKQTPNKDQQKENRSAGDMDIDADEMGSGKRQDDN
jgi:hypothetical protein